MIFPHSSPCPGCFLLVSSVLRLPWYLLFILQPERSHLSRGDTKSGCNMCRAGTPTGGKRSTLVWNKPNHTKRSRITETIWAFCCPLSHCLYLNITPRVPSTLKPQQKQRGSNIRVFKQMERGAASLLLIRWVAVLSVLTKVFERQFGLKATAKCILLFCSVRYFVQLKAMTNGGKSPLF